MRVLFLGDVVGSSGRVAVIERTGKMRERYALDFVVVNGENAAGGFARITEPILTELLDAGADVVTTGNHVFDQREALVFIERHDRLLRPLNFPQGTPGKGAGLFTSKSGADILVVNAQGRVFMADLDDPFRAVEREIEACGLKTGADAILIDFHAEATSEKEAIGHFVDGRATALIGTHTHVPTADEQILAKGTAYISDAGMCGDFNSVLGMDKEEPLTRFLAEFPLGASRRRSARRRCAVSPSMSTTRRVSRVPSPRSGWAGGYRRPSLGSGSLRARLGRAPVGRLAHAGAALRQQSFQAEDRLVEMQQRAVGIGAFVEQSEPRARHMVSGLGAEFRERERRHHFVVVPRTLLHGVPRYQSPSDPRIRSRQLSFRYG